MWLQHALQPQRTRHDFAIDGNGQRLLGQIKFVNQVLHVLLFFGKVRQAIEFNFHRRLPSKLTSNEKVPHQLICSSVAVQLLSMIVDGCSCPDHGPGYCPRGAEAKNHRAPVTFQRRRMTKVSSRSIAKYISTETIASTTIAVMTMFILKV